MLSIRPLHILLFLLVMGLWGFNFAVVKTGLLELTPILLTASRFALVAVILLPFVKPPHGRWKDILVITLLLGVLHFSLMFTGLSGLDASTAAIAIQLQVPFASILAAFFLQDKLGWRRGAGMAIAFVGVAIIAGEPRLQGQYLSLGMVILAACIWAVANLEIKRRPPLNGMTLLAWMSAFAAPMLFVCSLILEDGQFTHLSQIGWRGISSIVYQAVFVVVIGYGIWYRLLRQYDLNVAMPITLLVPPVGVLSGVVVLGERLTLTFIVGAVVTIVGVAIILFRRPGTAAPEAERV
jgi:O-acetylserine/cysteine efflux transporter